jgi:hypothetical protein
MGIIVCVPERNSIYPNPFILRKDSIVSYKNFSFLNFLLAEKITRPQKKIFRSQKIQIRSQKSSLYHPFHVSKILFKDKKA